MFIFYSIYKPKLLFLINRTIFNLLVSFIFFTFIFCFLFLRLFNNIGTALVLYIYTKVLQSRGGVIFTILFISFKLSLFINTLIFSLLVKSRDVWPLIYYLFNTDNVFRTYYLLAIRFVFLFLVVRVLIFVFINTMPNVSLYKILYIVFVFCIARYSIRALIILYNITILQSILYSIIALDSLLAPLQIRVSSNSQLPGYQIISLE